MNSLKERRERIQIEEPVHIPTLDGKGIAETIMVPVPAWRDPKDGEIYLDGEALAILDRVKARHMGLLAPEDLKGIRERLNRTQKQMSDLLQMGAKTWTRWESGHERPSRSLNILLCALRDGRLTISYLESLQRPSASLVALWMTLSQAICTKIEPVQMTPAPSAQASSQAPSGRFAPDLQHAAANEQLSLAA